MSELVIARIMFVVVLLLASCTAAAYPSTTTHTTVTTYVTKVQCERRSTRWTLTEWLKIKERMRMMDLWLAIFSKPKKDKFSPEFSLSYNKTSGNILMTNETLQQAEAAVLGTQVKTQLWMTNLVTATTGIKTINVDFGVEFFQHKTGDVAGSIGDDVSAISGDSIAGGANISTQYYTGDLRLFGKNIQDSSLVVKYGRYDSRNEMSFYGDDSGNYELGGSVKGLELSLYLFKWLGIEGSALQFDGKQTDYAGVKEGGLYFDYQAYVEVSLLRFTLGKFEENWVFQTSDGIARTSEKGVMGGVKLQF